MVDAPRFAWRGVLLDVGRHFFGVPFILKLLDVCAFYKVTRFHWHLTEDQARSCAQSPWQRRVACFTDTCCIPCRAQTHCLPSLGDFGTRFGLKALHA